MPRAPRTSRRELSPQLHSQLCELKAYDLRYTKIDSVHPEIPLSTIKTTILHERLHENNKSRSCSGQPHKITKEEQDNLISLIISNPHIKYKERLNNVNINIHRKTLINLFQNIDIRK
jgi:hypothetical protein